MCFTGSYIAKETAILAPSTQETAHADLQKTSRDQLTAPALSVAVARCLARSPDLVIQIRRGFTSPPAIPEKAPLIDISGLGKDFVQEPSVLARHS